MGTRYYVKASGGNDTNPGTTTISAFATISHGCIVAVAGDTVVCLSGTYNASLFINTTNMKSGTTASPITLLSVTPFAAVFKALAAPATGGGNDAMLECRCNGWTLDGFEFDGSAGYNISAGGTAVWALGGAGQYRCGAFISGANCIIQNCHIHHTCQQDPGGSGGSGAQIEGFYNSYVANFSQIRYNHIHNCANFNTSNKSHGIYCTTSECYVYGNLIYNEFGGVNFHGWHGFTGGYCANNTIFHGSNVGILFGQGDGGAAAGVANFKCFNNIVQDIVGATALGICDFGGPPSYPAFGTGNNIKNNMTYGCTKAYSLTATIASSFSRSGPVGFVNYIAAGGGDYHLSTGSTAIGLGIASLSGYNAPVLDIDGVVRPQGGTWDMGAYEFVPAGSTSTGTSATVSVSVSISASGSPAASVNFFGGHERKFVFNYR